MFCLLLYSCNNTKENVAKSKKSELWNCLSYTEVYLTFLRLAANFSESAENFQKYLIKIQPQMPFDLNDHKRPNSQLKQNVREQ